MGSPLRTSPYQTQQRDSAARYEAVRRALADLPGQVSVLDFGAHTGYFATRLAAAGHAVTAVESEPLLAPAPNLTVVRRHVDVDEIGSLGHHDVVLALSVVHHFAEWCTALDAFRRLARMLLIVEVPHPDERLRHVPARHELAALHALVAAVTERTLVSTPATRQPHLRRDVVTVAPLRTGTVFAGSGTHARTQRQWGHQFMEQLNYPPYPGSLNVRLDGPAELGEAQVTVRIDPRRVYRLWRARIAGNVYGHVMDLGSRGHGPDCVELLAPVRLRDEFALRDGDRVDVEVLW